MCDAIEQMYKTELEIKNSLINNNQDMYELQAKHFDSYQKLLAANDNLGAKMDYGFDLFFNVKIPVEILKKSSLCAMSGNIKTFDRDKVNSFFWNQFSIDVSSVDVIEIPNMPDHAEAFALECGVNDHFIGIPSANSNAFLSYDLLIHEFAHAIEFTERRKNKSPAHILTFSLLSETIAHYYQMIYMLKHSSLNDRLGMLASITQAYLFYRCMRIMLKVAPKERNFDSNRIYNDSEFVEFTKAYSGTDILDQFFERYHGRDFYIDFDQIHAQRLGFFLALNFIKYELDITELFHTKRPKGGIISLEDLISQTTLKPEVLFNFSEMEETITKFVNGSL